MEQHPPPPRRAAVAAPADHLAGDQPSLLDEAGSSQAATASRQAVQAEQLSQTAATELRIVRKLSAWAVFAHVAGQTAPLLAWATLPAGERAQRVGSILLMLAFHLLLFAAPRFYLRHSTQLQIALRLLYFSFPLMRKPRGIQGALNGRPTPGAAGALLDVLRVAWGSRIVAVLLTSLITPLDVLPLVPHLILQVYAIAMVRSNSSLCAAPLLAHPITRQRLRRLYHWMDVLLLVLPSGALLLPGKATDSLTQQTKPGDDSDSSSQQPHAAMAQCEGALNFLAAVLGLLLPLLFLLKTEPAAPLARLQEQRTGQRGNRGMPGLLTATWRRFEAGAEDLLRELAGHSWLAGGPPPPDTVLGSGWERCIAWLLLLAAAWVWCAAPALAAAAVST